MKWTNIDITKPNLKKVRENNFSKTMPLVLRVWLSKNRHRIFQGCVIKWFDGKISFELWIHETGKSDHKPMIYSRDSFYEVEWLNESSDDNGRIFTFEDMKSAFSAGSYYQTKPYPKNKEFEEEYFSLLKQGIDES
jgi:hypothetical protein